MTKLLREIDLKAQLRDVERRLHALETQSPRAYAVKDAAGQIRFIAGSLDILGGSYIGLYGWVVFNASGGVVASQMA